MEQRLAGSEQNIQYADQKGTSNQGIISDIVDRMESKVLGLEQTIDMLKNEQNRDKENVGRLEVNNVRSNEDF